MRELKYFAIAAQEERLDLGSPKSLRQPPVTGYVGNFLSQEGRQREAGQETIVRKKIQRKRDLTVPRFGPALLSSIVTVERTKETSGAL